MALGKYATFCAVLWTTLFSQHFGSASECGLSTHTLTIDEQERTYHTYIPIQVCDNPDDFVPLVMALHCFGGKAKGEQDKFMPVADAYGFVLVTPEGFGSQQSWNGRYCCGDALSQGLDDLSFLEQVVHMTTSMVNISQDSVYVTACVSVPHIFEKWLDLNQCNGSHMFDLVEGEDGISCWTGVACAANTTFCAHRNVVHGVWSHMFPMVIQVGEFFVRDTCVQHGTWHHNSCRCHHGWTGRHCTVRQDRTTQPFVMTLSRPRPRARATAPEEPDDGPNPFIYNKGELSQKHMFMLLVLVLTGLVCALVYTYTAHPVRRAIPSAVERSNSRT